jgi:hypothetical protein
MRQLNVNRLLATGLEGAFGWLHNPTGLETEQRVEWVVRRVAEMGLLAAR